MTMGPPRWREDRYGEFGWERAMCRDIPTTELTGMGIWFDETDQAYKMPATCNRCGSFRVHQVSLAELVVYNVPTQYAFDTMVNPRCPCRDRELAHQVERKRCAIGAAVQRRRDARVRTIDRRRAAWSSDED